MFFFFLYFISFSEPLAMIGGEMKSATEVNISHDLLRLLGDFLWKCRFCAHLGAYFDLTIFHDVVKQDAFKFVKVRNQNEFELTDIFFSRGLILWREVIHGEPSTSKRRYFFDKKNSNKKIGSVSFCLNIFVLVTICLSNILSNTFSLIIGHLCYIWSNVYTLSNCICSNDYTSSN